MLSHQKGRSLFDAKGLPSCQVVCSEIAYIVPTQLFFFFFPGGVALWHVCGRSIGLGVIRFMSRTHSLNHLGPHESALLVFQFLAF